MNTPPRTTTTTQHAIPPFVIKATIAASLGGVLFGYDLGIISAALPELTRTFELSPEEEEMVVSFLYIGCCIGAIFGGLLCDRYGRKRTILFTDVIFVIGASVLYSAQSIDVILGGRIVVGCAVAISGIADVAYLHEISPARYRGNIVSCNEACISLGFLVSYIVGYIMSISIPEDSWRYMFLMGCAIAIIQCLAMSCMPESPVWLKYKGRCQDAEYALMQIYGENYVDNSPATNLQMCKDDNNDGDNEDENDIDDLNTSDVTSSSREELCQEFESETSKSSPSSENEPTSSRRHGSNYSSLQIEEASPPSSPTSARSDDETPHHSIDNIESSQESELQPESFFQYLRHYHRQVIIAIFLAIMQQFCGHTNVLNFAPSIFREVGFYSERTELVTTVLVGTVKFLTTCLVIYKIEYIAGGRRYLLISGLSLIAFSLLLLTFAYLGEGGFVDVDELTDDYSNTTDGVNDNEKDEDGKFEIEKIAAMVGVFGVAIGYAMSFGPLVWLLVSEIFPSSIRGRALGGSTIISYLSAILVSYTFLTGQEMFGPSIPFAIYCLLTILSIIFAILLIPDTAGKTPFTIHTELKRMWSRGSSLRSS